MRSKVLQATERTQPSPTLCEANSAHPLGGSGSEVFEISIEIGIIDFRKLATLKRLDAGLDLHTQYRECARADGVFWHGTSPHFQRQRINSNHSSSVSTATPASRALSSLEPAPGPATT
jgi:hypothetical protein